jgi:hypothetical protein
MTKLSLRALIIDGHPDEGRLMTYLLDHYATSVGKHAIVERLAVRDLVFDPNLRRGYGADQDWEPDLKKVAKSIDVCDHLVIGFPLWWGGEPILLKGLLDLFSSAALRSGIIATIGPGTGFWRGARPMLSSRWTRRPGICEQSMAIRCRAAGGIRCWAFAGSVQSGSCTPVRRGAVARPRGYRPGKPGSNALPSPQPV